MDGYYVRFGDGCFVESYRIAAQKLSWATPGGNYGLTDEAAKEFGDLAEARRCAIYVGGAVVRRVSPAYTYEEIKND